LARACRVRAGGFPPPPCPMDGSTYHRVLDEMVIERDGRLYAWSIPISLPVTREVAATIRPGNTVALVNGGQTVATLEVSDVFEWDKALYLRKVYGTERTD